MQAALAIANRECWDRRMVLVAAFVAGLMPFAAPLSPDPANLFDGFNHCCISLTTEGLTEFRHIHDHAIDAVFGWRMRIRGSMQAQCLRTFVRTGPLSESNEKSLFRGEPVPRL